MHRSDLLDALLAACRTHDAIALETSKEAVALEDRGDSACVTCTDGTLYDAPVVVGAMDCGPPPARRSSTMATRSVRSTLPIAVRFRSARCRVTPGWTT